MDQDDDPMSTDMQPDTAAQTLDSLASGVAALGASSRGIPSERDFHFFNNFDEFKRPLRHVAGKSQSLLEAVGGSSKALFRQSLLFPAAAEGEEFDAEEAYDWLVNVNDEILERIDASLEEHGQARRDGEEGKTEGMEDGGFQMVYGKKKKMAGSSVVAKGSMNNGGAGEGSVKVAGHRKGVAGKAKVSFHVATIKRPQEEFSILVNNANQPFQHVWIQTNEDGSSFVHPLENLPVADFVDWSPADGEPVPPPPMEDTPFKFVEDVKDLKQLATKLRGVQEFAVDLEHNQYRSFQGLTCLMQISTREEDYIVDTLKLKIHVGPHLREVFRDPTKRKVMHGADRDIVWLQRDFGIYVCNMFDTGQASRVMNLERKSLEFLLQHFCGVTANKEYQNADWRIRPLPKEMTRYAREDTHYLLYIYDTMRIKLLSMPKENENADPPLLEVYKRSAGICTNLYEKELLTENSYLHIYGLQDAGFSAQQLSVVAALVEWRDAIARAEDESTGYILPNKTLLEIAKQMPVTTNKLHRILKSKHPYVERSLSSVVSIVRHAVQNADAFEETVQRLKAAHSEKMARDKEANAGEGKANADEGKNLTSDSQESEAVTSAAAVDGGNEMDGASKILQLPSVKDNKSFETGGRFGRDDRHIIEKGNPMVSSLYRETSGSPKISFGKATEATVQVLKKPAGAFGALLGNSVPKRKIDSGKKDNEEVRLEKIRSSVSLEIPSFLGRNELPNPQLQEPSKPQLLQTPAKFIAPPATSPKVEDIIVLDDDSDVEPQKDDTEPITAPIESNSMGLEDVILLDDDSDLEPESLNASKSMDHESAGNSSMSDGEEDPTSLSDLSNSFQKCLQSNSQSKKASESKESKELSGGSSEFKPFNYAAAIRFWENTGEKSKAPPVDGSRRRNSSGSAGRGTSGASQGQKDDGTREFAAPRRSQAFPVSGNRSATFR